MRLVSERTLIDDFFKDLHIYSELNLLDEEFLNSIDSDSQKDFWLKYNADHLMSHNIMAPFFAQLFQLDRKACSIVDINSIVIKIKEAVKFIRYGRFAPQLIIDIPPCNECDAKSEPLISFQNNCPECDCGYVCMECLSEAFKLIGDK